MSTVRAQQLVHRAQAAQDRLGWTEPENHEEVTYAAVDLARVVTDMAQLLMALAREGETR